MPKIVNQLITLLGEQSVIYGRDVQSRATSYWEPEPILAKAIVRPNSTEQVSQIMALCHKFDQKIVVLGGQTAGVQGLKTTSDDLCISLEALNKIEDIDELGRTITVQSGCLLQTVQEHAKAHDLLFALDLGARGTCTIGGNIATNAGGLEVIRYGMMREQVLGLEAVLADGTVISSMNKMLKNNTGYDLKQLFIGSEGTLGIVTRAVLKLHESMSSCCTAFVATDSFDKVVQLLKKCDREFAGTLTRFEIMNGNYYREVTKPNCHTPPLERNQNYYVVIETTGAQQKRDSQQFEETLESAFEKALILDAVIATSSTNRDGIWEIRENFEPILQYKPFFLYDVSLPIATMENYINQVEMSVKSRWPDAKFTMLGHIGDSNIHFVISPQDENQTSEEDLHLLINDIVYSPLKAIEGSPSAEHGIGFEKKKYLSINRTAEELDLMKVLKRCLDPKNILNTGRIIDS